MVGWRSSPNGAAGRGSPKVMSAVVHIEPDDALDGVVPATLERLTAAAFGQRRKMLRQSLRGVPGALDALAVIGVDPTRRAETLSVGDFVALARAMPQPIRSAASPA